MDDELKLALPEREPADGKSRKGILILLVLLLAAAAANLAATLVRTRGGASTRAAFSLAPEDAKELALKLESQGLHEQAAAAWKDYLQLARSGGQEQAKIWYRIGKIHQEQGAYEDALDAYYRSESHGNVKEIESELSMRIQACLEAAGRFAALHYELAERVGLDKARSDAGEEVLAEIGATKITRAELDRRVEEQIDRQLETLAPFVPEDQRKTQKEALLKRFASPAERMQLANQMVLEEILYRKARQDKLAEEPHVQAMLRDVERGFLAQQVLDRELAEQIKTTQGDVRTYYEANKQAYVEPEKAMISHILVPDETSARALMEELDKGAGFAELAAKHSVDEATRSKGGDLDAWVSEGAFWSGMENPRATWEAMRNTPAGQVVKTVIKSERGHHIIKIREWAERRQRSLEEAGADAYRDLMSKKSAEVQQALISRLKEQYNVVIHTSRFQAGGQSGG